MECYLKEYRERVRMTQEDLARFIGYERSAIARWESGVPIHKHAVEEQLMQILQTSSLYAPPPSLEEDKKLGLVYRVPSYLAFKPGIPRSKQQQFNHVPTTDARTDFAFYVPDDSMVGMRVLNGDMLMMSESVEPKNGDLVLAAIKKRAPILALYYRHGYKVWLRTPEPRPEESEHMASDVEILGVALEARLDLRC